MTIEHNHAKATPSATADILEEEIETIEKTIVSLIQEVLSRGSQKITSSLSKPRILLFIGAVLFLKLISSRFSKEASIRHRIIKLKNQNLRLIKHNKKLQHMLTETKKKSTPLKRASFSFCE